jgi:biotin transport system substrate-specific component
MSRPSFWTRWASPDGTMPPGTLAFAWPLSLILGAIIVAVSAQVALPVPFSPVPMTLQGLAVIVVGGIFGAAAGAGALVLYLVAGMLGAPVFAMGSSGLVRVLGPTGGYLLAFPVAAFVAGVVGERGNLLRSVLAALIAMFVIHLGGWAWLALGLGGVKAATMGVAPFVVQDALKVVLAALILWRAHHAFRPNA